MSGPSPANYIWWLAARSAGAVALVLVTCSVMLGLAMAARLIPVAGRRRAVRVHEHLALLSLGAISAHGLLLLADPWLKAGVSGITLPFSIAYRPLWTGLGIIGGYLAAALGLSFYVRRRIGARLWRKLHRLTALVYVLGLVHTLGAGTDAAIPAVRIALLTSGLPVLFLFVLRWQRGRVHSAGSRRQAKEKLWAMWQRLTSRPASRRGIALRSLRRRFAWTTTRS